MGLLDPHPFPFDYEEWKNKPFHIRCRMLCEAWAVQGFGAPRPVYILYAFKLFFYVGMWIWFASFSRGLGDLQSIHQWWFQPEALAKAIVWSMLFEGLGMASGSGPLSGRYVPPFGGCLYYLRPGTIKIPLKPGIPFFGGDQRRIIDCLLYLLHISQLIRVLVAPEVTPELLWPTILILPLMGLTDRAMFLTSRPEHYLIGVFCFLFPDDALAGAKWVWCGIWFWAATSKINLHFPSVIGVMLSNSGLLPSWLFRERLFRSIPGDLRTSRFTASLAHFGMLTEYLFPTLLMLGFTGIGPTLFEMAPAGVMIGLAIMVGFHAFITLSVPMGVPIEWNLMMVYGGFVLFGAQSEVSPFSMESSVLCWALVLMMFVVPLVGNLFPAWVSFLLGMRFYAGNWAYSVWLFRDDAERKIADHVTTTSAIPMQQLSLLYEPQTIEMIMNRVISFRMMHLHGRVLHDVLPIAVQDIDRYTWRDGELVCGITVGWNFGDGHLHNEHLLQALQRRCGWESGQLRVIFVDPQPMLRPRLDWRVWDARDGHIASGRVAVKDLTVRQPYPLEPIHA